jgi:hypothetical protein
MCLSVQSLNRILSWSRSLRDSCAIVAIDLGEQSCGTKAMFYVVSQSLSRAALR